MGSRATSGGGCWCPSGRSVAILSPHLDDAALSLGATIAAAVAAGRHVRVVTVLAGDPEHERPPGEWDRACGFASSAEAARVRRREDAVACAALGAAPVWLPYGDEQYERGGSDDEIWEALAAELAGADVVLVPGFPLAHPDHAWLSRLASDRLAPARLAFYVEQPYASELAIPRGFGPAVWRAVLDLLGRRTRLARFERPQTLHGDLGVQWLWSATTAGDRRTKYRSLRAYRSQRRALGRQVAWRIRLLERACGGELIGVPDRRQPRNGQRDVRERVAERGR